MTAAGRGKQATVFAVFWDNLRETVSCGKKRTKKKYELNPKSKINQHAPNIEITFLLTLNKS